MALDLAWGAGVTWALGCSACASEGLSRSISPSQPGPWKRRALRPWPWGPARAVPVKRAVKAREEGNFIVIKDSTRNIYVQAKELKDPASQ